MSAADRPDGAELQRTLEAAVGHHRAGRLDEAERLYRNVLAVDPGHLRAAHNLGAVRLAQRDFAGAEAIFARVLAREPGHPHAWGARINALIGANRFEDAEAEIAAGAARGREAIEAEVRLRQHWADASRRRRQPLAAEAQLRRICALTPRDPEAHNDLGCLLMAIGQAEAAASAFRQALDIDPGHVASLANLGAVYAGLQRPDEAEACYRRALERSPRHATAVRNLAILLREQGREHEADALETDALTPSQRAEAEFARGQALHAAGRYEAAVAAFQRALGHGADSVSVLPHLAGAQADLGRREAAVATLDDALARNPHDPRLLHDRALIRLSSGDFAGGWSDYEARWREPVFLSRCTNASLTLRDRLATSPEDAQFAGRRVLAIGEQGVGDQIMFASVLPDLAQVAGETACMCDDRLVSLFAQSFPGVNVRGAGVVHGADVIVPLGSLPYLWRRQAEDFPGTPYLRPGAAALARWAERLGPRETRLRVGVSWRGGAAQTRGRQRSMPLAQLAPVLDLPDCEVVSLQYGDVAAEVAAVNAARARPVRLFPAAEIDDFEDLAALVLNLDVVVTVQTTLAHLTGAVGAPGLVMIPHVAEWRYGAEGEAMPWYRSLRLFRQPAPSDWDTVLARIVDTVRAMPATRP